MIVGFFLWNDGIIVGTKCDPVLWLQRRQTDLAGH